MDNYTSLQDVYVVFLSDIEDYQLAMLDEEELDTELLMLLKKALSKCLSITNVTIDVDMEIFSRPLTDMEINVIASYMCVEWIKPKVYNLELLKQRLNSKDYSIYSQANHLAELREIQNSMIADAMYWSGQLELNSYANGVLSEK